jgi:hypothetical protein
VPDRFEPGAVLAAVKDAARRASAVAKAILDRRLCPASGERQAGTKKRVRQEKLACSNG